MIRDKILEAYEKTILVEDKTRKDRIEIIDLVINYLKQAKKQVIKDNIKMANKNISFGMEKIQGDFWKKLFKE